ncbi:MAG: cytochrome P450 [Halioglobus sp.]
MSNEKANPVDYSLLDPEIQQCPYHAYKVYREAPVFQMPETGHFMVSRYEDIYHIVRTPEIFSMDTTQGGGHPYDNDEKIAELFSSQGWENRTVLSYDPPLHGTYRSLLEHCFTNKRIKALQPQVEKLANSLIDKFIDKGEVDFIEEFCYPLPMMVIAIILGLPQEDLEHFKRWSIAWVAPFAMSDDKDAAFKYAQEHVELKAYLVEKFAEKRLQPDEGIISDLVHTTYTDTEGNKRPLNENELLSISEQLLVGGNETTNNVMASAMLLLLQNPDQMELLLGDIDKYIKGFVHESLRYESPTQGLYRYTLQDTTVGDTFIPKDSMVHIRFAAGNRDDEQFPEADKFDITRKNAATHLAFSHGQHHCMGAPVSRMEMNVGFTQVLKRLKNIRLAEGKNDFKHLPGFTLRALENLVIEFDT